jgi:aminopeptidase YwaD
MFTKLKYIALLLLPVLFLAVISLDAQAQRKGKKKKKSTPTAEQVLQNRLMQHVGVLAADSLEGRRTGTEGEKKAVRYITAQYEAFGIPGAGSAGYLQPFEIDEGKSYRNQTSLMIDRKLLVGGKDYFPFAWSGEGKFESNASVALSEAGDTWWIDIEPTIEINEENPHFILGTHLQELAKGAAAKGAKSIIFFNDGSKPDSLSFNAKDRSEMLSIPVIYLTAEAKKTLAITDVSNPAVVAQVRFEKISRRGINVVAGIDNGAATTIILGAHLDHLGYGEDANSRHTGEPGIHNGADDNASGTASVLELARIIKAKADKRFNYIFLHFSGEELGLYGSKYFTEHSTIDLGKVTYMINLDMVGRFNDSSKALTIGGIGTSPSWSQLVQPTTDFLLKIDSSGTGPSDHTSFYRKDIPVLFFFTGLHTDYHKPSDDADKINYAGMVKIINYINGIVDRSPADNRLAFTKTREQSMGGRGFKVSIGIMPDYTFSGTGVKADGVIDGRPAQKAGLQANDVILQLGDHLITGVDTYMQALNRFEKGQTTTVVVKRGSEVKELPITF